MYLDSLYLKLSTQSVVLWLVATRSSTVCNSALRDNDDDDEKTKPLLLYDVFHFSNILARIKILLFTV